MNDNSSLHSDTKIEKKGDVKLLTNKNKSTSFKSLERAIAILSCFSFDYPQRTASDIASCTGIPKSSVHRFIRTFIDEGFLRESNTSGSFSPGLKLLELGSIVHKNLDVRSCAKAAMEELSNRCKLTVHLVVRDRDEGIYVEKLEPEGQHIHYSQVGRRIPLHCTAAGKVLLSGISNNEIKELFLNTDLEKLTEHSITQLRELLNEVSTVREQGWSQDNQELEIGLCCMAVPVRNHLGQITAAVSSSGLKNILETDKKELILGFLKEAGLSISEQLGYKRL